MSPRAMVVPLAIVASLLLLVVGTQSQQVPTYTAADFSANTYYLFGSLSNFNTTLVLVNPGEYTPIGLDLLVTLIYNESFNDLGWDFLQVSPYYFVTPLRPDNAPFDPTQTRESYFYAGYAEGLVTAKKLLQFFNDRNYNYTNQEAAWVESHLQYVNANIQLYSFGSGALNETREAEYWRQVGNLWMQLEGLAEGVRQSGLGNLTFADLYRFNFRYEIGDVFLATNGTNSSSFLSESDDDNDRIGAFDERLMTLRPRDMHCSALVKVTDSDIFFSHDTWGGFGNMIRQYKVYQFQTTVALSGYAGQIHSGDDWYITSNNLASQETTNEYFGAKLARQNIFPQCVSEFMRVMVANYLSTGGQEWCDLFARHHSGTYCNQYMVLDYKLYTPGDQGAALQDNLLWVVEEMPGNVTSADVTQVLRNTSYWASYNIPYFKNIYDESGFEKEMREIGDFFSYTKYARPEIFKRNHSFVTDLPSMQRLMQYNEWQTDPLSVITNCSGNCNPVNNPTLTIAARGDLVPKNASLPLNPKYSMYLNVSAFGAIDSKIASYAMITNNMQASVFCGPTPQQPTFSWSQLAWLGRTRPAGAVETYNFQWQSFNGITVQLPWTPAPSSPNTGSTINKGLVVGLVVGISGAVMIAGVVIRHFYLKRKAQEGGDYVKI